MENIWNGIQNSLLAPSASIVQIPMEKIVLIIIILMMTLLLRQFFSTMIIKRIEHFTRQTDTTLDDALLEIVKRPLGWLIFLFGLWIVELVIAENLNSQVKEILAKAIEFSAVVIIAFIVYHASPLLGQLLRKLTLHTETDLDDLLVPYIPKIFQIAAIVIVAIKGSEILLGASAGALIGLLGGAGVALGLLFKDIIYDWCCTIIIYLDNLYKPGDIISLDGLEGFVQVIEIGLRSTKLHILMWGTIRKIPNSKMINGIVSNWSQNADEAIAGINFLLKIDGISAEKTAKICAKLRELPQYINNLSNKTTIYFKGLEENARVINVRVYVNVISNKIYYETWERVNLAILKLLEKEGIDPIHVFLRTDPEVYKKSKESIKN